MAANSNSHPFYEDDDYVLRENRLAEKIAISTRSTDDVDRHLRMGFAQRLGMIQTSRIYLSDIDPGTTLDPYTTTEAGIHVNCYYLMLRGALDNLAWALQYHHNLFPGVAEDSPKGRNSIGLLGVEFIKALQNGNSEQQALEQKLSQFTNWVQDLKTLRDPAAHRIPLYIPPKTVDQSGVQVPQLLMVNSIQAGLKPFSVADQIRADHDSFLEISEVVVEHLTKASSSP